MIKISVIMPVYNAGSYIEECLESVLAQSLKETEIICVDDGSTDDSRALIEEYMKRDKRIKLFVQKNQGAGSARNKGIKNASGQFVVFMDPDDLYPENTTLETLYEAAVKNNVKICGGSFSWLNNDGTINTFFENNYAGYTFNRDEKLQYRDYQFDYGYHRFIYDREFLVNNNLFFPGLKRFQDPPFFVDAMIAAKEFYAVKDVVYRYRNGYKSVEWNNERVYHLLDGLTHNLKAALNNRLYNLYYLTFHRFAGDFIPKLAYVRTWKFFYKLIKIRRITDRSKVNVNFYRKFRQFLIKVFFETLISVKSSSKFTVFTLFGMQLKIRKKQVVYGPVVNIALMNNQGFGDCLMETAFWKEVKKQVPNISIDYYTRNAEAFRGNPLFNKTEAFGAKFNHKNYDIVLLNDRLYRLKGYNHEKVRLKAPLLANYIDANQKLVKSFGKNINYDLLTRFGLLRGKNRRGQFDLNNIFSYDTDSKPFISWDVKAFDILQKHALNEYKYITLTRACDSVFKYGHVKMWPMKYYDELISSIKKQYPEIKIVQLGTSSQYGIAEGIDTNLIGRTSFDELKVILKHSLLHIDNDCGLMHLKNALGGVSCIMWGPTSLRAIGYKSNINLYTGACSDTCSYIIPRWMDRCVKGLKEPECMTSITPEMVFDKISEYIDNLKAGSFDLTFIKENEIAEIAGKRADENIKTAFLTDDFYGLKNFTDIENNAFDIFIFNGNKNIGGKYKNAEISFPYNIARKENSYDIIIVKAAPDENLDKFFYKEISRILKPGGGCYFVSQTRSGKHSLKFDRFGKLENLLP